MPTKPKYTSPDAPIADKHMAVARGVLADGKSLRAAMLENGYSPRSSSLGVRATRREIPGIDAAFMRVAKEISWKPEEVKAAIRHRLMTDLTNGKSSGVAREAELLGRDKTIDMFVRTTDVQIGIFNNLLEAPDPLPPADVDQTE